MKHVRFTVTMLMALVVGSADARVTVAQERAGKLPATIPPLVRTVDLDIGEMQEVELVDGSKARVKLLDVQETRDRVRNAVREAKVTVEVNGAAQTLTSAMYHLPVTVGGVQIDCSITRGYVTGSRQQNPWGLKKDARLRLWPAGSPWIRPGTFTYPVRQCWFASDTQMANEPCYVNGAELPSQKSIYYHWGLDFGGAEGLVEIVAATDGLVVSAADQTLPEYKDSPAKPRYDVIYLVDGRGWYYRYSHLMTIDVQPGQRVRMGERIGLLGKEGGSGGWSHLHFDITSRQPSGEWGIQDAYAYAWQAYQQEYRPTILAVARPHQLVTAGEKVRLDGTKSWSATGKIARYEWTFTDGGTATGPVVERIYQQPGAYSEILKITDEAGHVAWDFAVVEVQDLSQPDRLPPSIHATHFPTTDIRTGDAITFKVRTFRTTDDEERWDFGDGSPAVTVRSDGNANVHAKDGYAVTEHRYAQPGRYLVRVERSNQREEKAVGRLAVEVQEHFAPRTRVAIRAGQWFLNDEVAHRGTKAEGLLMNVRMVNATFEDRRRGDFDPEANTDKFLAQLPDYVAHGVRGFTLCLQGGMPGYEGALNSAFEPDGALRDSYLRRVRRVIEACDRHGAVVILGCYYQRQDQVLRDEAAVRAGVVNVAKWIERSGFANVVLEIANEFGHGGFDHRLLKTADGIAELIRLAKETSPALLVSASGLGGGRLPDSVAQASDFLLIHFNNTRIDDIPARIDAVRKYGKPIVCNEDVKVGQEGAKAAELCVENGVSWGLMLAPVNQYHPFVFQGTADDPEVYAALKRLTSAGSVSTSSMGVPPMNHRQDADATKSRGQEIRDTMGGSGAILDEAIRGVELGPIRSLGHGITPGIATDSYGGVHIVYMNAGRIWYVQVDAAGTFRDPQEIPAPEGEAVYNSPHLVLDPEEVPHLVFERDFTSKSKKAWYTNRRQGVWKPPIEAICAPQQRANYPRLAVTESVALVGAFTPGTGFSGTLAKIVDLDAAPRVAATATTALWVPTPFVAGAGWIVLGRAGPSGHMLQAYGLDLEPAGTMRKISAGTPSKTGEPIAGLRDAKGVVHAVGITGQAGVSGHRDWIWYNNSARMEAGQGVILGPVFSAGVSEYVYPSMTQDSAGRLYLAYRDFDTGQGKLVTVSPEGFGQPISIAPSATRRLRWNPQIAAGPDGRIYVVWDDNDTIHFRVIRVADTMGARTEDSPSARSKPAVLSYFPPPEAQGGWRKLEKPEDIHRLAGMDPAKLDELKEWLLQSDKRNFAAVVIRRGHIVLEVERGNNARTDSRRVASVSKAVCATVLAIASEQSRQGLTPVKMTFDDPAFQFIPWAQPLSDPRKAQITVRQLLNHTSGLCPEAIGAPNDGTWEYVLGHSGDPRTAKLAFDPGAGCGYTTHALHHASLVCETVTGKPYDQFAIEALFQPLGIERWWFQFFEGGQKIGRHPTHGLGMPARDLARIAYCMLQGGRWGDRQVIPQWFVDETAAPTHKVTSPEMRWKLDPRTFSHGWELAAVRSDGIPADARYKPGSGGQLVAFVPSLDLVISRQTGSSGEWAYEEYLRRACAAVILDLGDEK